MSEQIPGTFPEKLTRAGQYLSDRLETRDLPVITPFDFFHIVWRMYQDADGQKLYLRHDTPTRQNYTRLRTNLKKTGIINADRDYGSRIIRVLTASDLPAEEIVCLVDPTAYVSHLSAMQRWGLTDRRPEALMLTRPNRVTAAGVLREYMREHLAADENTPFPLRHITHPQRVRRRPLHIHETKTVGAHIRNRGNHMRLATLGQTFLDTLQRPNLCGGIRHVLDIWAAYAEIHLDEIVSVVDGAVNPLVKSRAGYIIEEHLGLSHEGVEPWKALSHRGGNRKLDPAKAFVPTFSKTWMISLNV